MTRIDAFRRFLLPCISLPATTTSGSSATTGGKKRLSTSLRDDLDDQDTQDSASSSTAASSPATVSDEQIASAVAPQRPSKTMVIGTIFGPRKGHVWFCVQHDRLSVKPLLLLELSIATHQLVHEMGSDLVRIALECPARPELSSCPLKSVPVWMVYCNGKKLGFAARKSANEWTRSMLKKMQSMTVGAGVMPSGSESADPEKEVMYMRANYEHVVGSSDSESFHLINPDASSQELSIFLLRTST